MINKSDKIYIAGHRGMVGSSVWRLLESQGYTNLVGRRSSELDLRDQAAVNAFFEQEKPKYVILAAAKVGGIHANSTMQGDFIYDNLMIEANCIHSAYKHGVEKLVYLGSSCIYPRECPQPMKEEYLLTGKLEPTNEGYAVAKIAGLKLAEYYHRQKGFNAISLMPPNLYGPNDSFDLENSHVLSALIRRFTEATDRGDSSITLWGTGVARREFMHVDDMAAATVYMFQHYNEPGFINIGTAEEVSIKELALQIAEVTGFKGEINWDSTKPDGMPRKCMDSSRMLALGFKPAISLREGIHQMLGVFREYQKSDNFK